MWGWAARKIFREFLGIDSKETQIICVIKCILNVLICLISCYNLCINCLGGNMKQLDKVKALTQRQQELSQVEQVREYLENDRMIKGLRSYIRDEIRNNLTMKDQSFGVPRTFKDWSEVNMIDGHVTKDRKQVIGILKGDKSQADIRLQHYSPKQVKAYSALIIKGWVG